ncbi:MAG: hypothetical protein ACJ8F7_05675 [Gemmataceae bacterium]
MIQDAMQTGFPPAGQLLILVAYAIVAGFLAVRFFRWELDTRHEDPGRDA